MGPLTSIMSMVPDQNGISETCYIVEIQHSGLECSTLYHSVSLTLARQHKNSDLILMK